jgi:hypothetical protein
LTVPSGGRSSVTTRPVGHEIRGEVERGVAVERADLDDAGAPPVNRAIIAATTISSSYHSTCPAPPPETVHELDRLLHALDAGKQLLERRGLESRPRESALTTARD